MLHHLLVIFNGAIFVIAVIAGIGPQTLALISQGIKRNHQLAIALTCFLADAILIILACIGLSISKSHRIFMIINILGILFISWFIWGKIRGLFKQRNIIHIDTDIFTKNQVILRGLAVTWLNPIIIVDTFIVIGGAASRYNGPGQIDFIVGALMGDFTWVFGITYLATVFSHKLNRRIVWQILDILTILIMCIIWYKTLLFII